MDNTAYFKLTYGLFVVGVEYNGKMNGCIINTATQATSEPGRMLATMMKSNLTTDFVYNKGSLSISVLAADCPVDRVAHFGMNKGREMDKFAGIAYKKDARNNPWLTEWTIARFSCRVEYAYDLGSHYLFVCLVEDCETLDAKEPLTYADYRRIKAGQAPKPAAAAEKAEPAKAGGRWVCSICHYVYDGATPFEELPADWRCPVCGRGKDVFLREG